MPLLRRTVLLRTASLVFSSIGRGLAVVLAAFCSLAILLQMRRPDFDPIIWMLDLRGLGLLERGLLTLWLTAMAVAAFAARAHHRPLRLAAFATFLAASLVAIRDAWNLAALEHDGDLVLGNGPSASIVLALAFAVIAAACLLQPPQGRRWRWSLSLASSAAAAFLFPWLLIGTLGASDYRRPAAMAVVFGSRAYADGTPSQTLRERTETGCALFEAGLARRLVFSGGPGDGDHHEVEVMRSLALQRGVPESVLLLDRQGLNTRATAAFVAEQAARGERVLAVSNDFHLPRIRLAFACEGIEALTVPVFASPRLSKRHYFMMRESAAFWWYLLRG